MTKLEMPSDTTAAELTDTEGGWEDLNTKTRSRDEIERENMSDNDGVSVSEPLPNKTSPRRRKMKIRPVGISQRLHTANKPRKLYTEPEVRPVPAPTSIKRTRIPYDEIHAAFLSGFIATWKYAVEVLSLTIYWMKKPLALFLAFWAMMFILGQLSASVRSTLAPLCILPPLSRTSFCGYSKSADVGKRADYPKMMDLQTKTFEQVLDDTVSSSNTAIDIKKAEIATRDLITLVKISNLSAKELLSTALAEFVADAKDTADGLHSLNAKADSAVDKIYAVNDLALRQIEAAKASAESSSLINYIWSSSIDPTEVVAASFQNTINVLSATFSKLIIEAEISLRNLEKLEERLHNIHDIVVQEDASLGAELDQLLGNLWTKLGGNRRIVEGVNENLSLLRNVGAYRRQALAHVTRVFFATKKISKALEELRDTVAETGILGDDIPLEAHVQSIRNGLERLKNEQLDTQRRQKDIERRLIDSF